jgi:hypothetical protein
MKEQYKSALNNIISDCIHLNTDISNQYNDSKLPKFIIKLLILRKKRKLLACVNKIKRGNVPLTRVDLMSFFNYIMSSFPLEERFGHIYNCRIITTEFESFLEASINIEDRILHNSTIKKIQAVFKFNIFMRNQYKFTLNLSVIDDIDCRFHFDIDLKELFYNGKKYLSDEKFLLTESIKIINKTIYNDISDYIKNVIMEF